MLGHTKQEQPSPASEKNQEVIGSSPKPLTMFSGQAGATSPKTRDHRSASSSTPAPTPKKVAIDTKHKEPLQSVDIQRRRSSISLDDLSPAPALPVSTPAPSTVIDIDNTLTPIRLSSVADAQSNPAGLPQVQGLALAPLTTGDKKENITQLAPELPGSPMPRANQVDRKKDIDCKHNVKMGFKSDLSSAGQLQLTQLDQDENKEIPANIQKWQDTFFQVAVKAIKDSDEDKINFLLGPNLFFLRNPLDSELLLRKFRENEELLIKIFYSNLCRMIQGLQQIAELQVKMDCYEKEVITNIKGIPTVEMVNTLRQRAASSDSTATAIQPQFTMPLSPRSEREGKFYIQKSEIDSFDNLKQQFKILSDNLLTDEDSMLNFEKSPYFEIKMEMDKKRIPSVVKGEFAKKIRNFIVQNPAEIKHFFLEILEKENKNLSHAIVEGLNNEIKELQKIKRLSKKGIANCYIKPIQESYNKKISSFMVEVEKVFKIFDEKPTVQDLTSLLMKFDKQKKKALVELEKKNQDFPVGGTQVENTRQTQEEVELNYTATFENWLLNLSKENDLSVFNSTEMKKIMGLEIGFVNFDNVRDELGNTLLHFAMRQCWEVKNTPVVVYEERVKRAMNIFTMLLSRGATVYARNNKGQAAHQYAMSAISIPKDLNQEQLFPAMLYWDWESAIKVLACIPCVTPTSQRVKEHVLTYSRKNEEKLAKWNFIDDLLYKKAVTAEERLKEVGFIAQMLYAAQDDMSDKILEDGIISLKARSKKGTIFMIFGEGRSSLYGPLAKMFEHRLDFVYVSLSSGDVSKNREIEQMRLERENELKQKREKEKEIEEKFKAQEEKQKKSDEDLKQIISNQTKQNNEQQEFRASFFRYISETGGADQKNINKYFPTPASQVQAASPATSTQTETNLPSTPNQAVVVPQATNPARLYTMPQKSETAGEETVSAIAKNSGSILKGPSDH